ncbi:Cysteine-rich receptor-like protein kinase [Ancistrocladus abbreviatus]
MSAWFDTPTNLSSANLDDQLVFYPGNTQNNTGNVTEFIQLLSDMLNALAVKAASGGSGKKFAPMAAKYNNVQTLYTIAQCTPDLSGKDCSRCLVDCIGLFPSCCTGKQGGRVVFPSCNMRFEIYTFYSIAAGPPLETPPPLLSSPALPAAGGRYWKERKVQSYEGKWSKIQHFGPGRSPRPDWART